MADVPKQERSRIKVLDVPAGRGVITLPLRAAGFDVVGCDLFPETFERTLENFRGHRMEEVFLSFKRGYFSGSLRRRLFSDPDVLVPTDATCVAGDMEGRLPFPDANFDFVISMEGIEHVRDRHKVLTEFRRLMKPEAKLLISTPNMLCLRARLAYAFTGQRTFKGHLDEHTGIWGRSADRSRTYHGHAFLINYFQLRYSLHHCGFRISRLLSSNISPSGMFALPFLLPWIALFTWRSQRHARKSFKRKQRRGLISASTTSPSGEILRHVLSPRMLLTTVLVLEAEAV